jgi:YVTN family beta-propeller protein
LGPKTLQDLRQRSSFNLVRSTDLLAQFQKGGAAASMNQPVAGRVYFVKRNRLGRGLAMFRFLFGVLILASNFLGVSRAIAGMGAGSGPGVITMPIRGRARWAALTLVLALLLLLPAGANPQNAYITNSGSNTVSVIDTATNTVTATIPVGLEPWGVAVTPDGSKIYVTNFGDTTVSVIETASNTVAATIPVGNRPQGVAVTPDGTKAYVTAGNTVLVIATSSNTVTATIPIAILADGVAVTPDGTKDYVTTFGGNVGVIDTATDKCGYPDPRRRRLGWCSGHPGWHQGLCR